MITFAERRTAALPFACPMPRCTASAGQDCHTPNGYRTLHQQREQLAAGTLPATGTHRLTDGQARRIEQAAEAGGEFEAPDSRATLRGEANARACADALAAAGYAVEFGTTSYGYRRMRLTREGWRTYWHHKRVIRRLPDNQHDQTCPCVTEKTTTPGGAA